MEARDRLSALGSAGAFCLRGTSLYFLSTGFVDARGNLKRDLSMDVVIVHLHLDCAGAGRRNHVHAGATMVRPPGRDVRGGAVCRQSLSPGDRVLAQRVCRTPGELSGAVVAVVRAESRGGRTAGGSSPWTRVGRGVADKRPGGCNDSLFDGAAVVYFAWSRRLLQILFVAAG